MFCCISCGFLEGKIKRLKGKSNQEKEKISKISEGKNG
jgi:hypothetical protein